MKKIILIAMLLVILSAVAVAKDNEFKKVTDVVIADDLRIVTLKVQFTDDGEIHHIEVVTNELKSGENIKSETGDITAIGFKIPEKELLSILTIRQLAETELKVYKGIK